MAAKATTEISVMEVSRGQIDFLILGRSPMISNAMSAKAAQQLLLPPQKKNAAEKASSLKHDPMDEFRRSLYRARSDDAPTRILVKSTAFKAALISAGIDIPGATKSQMGRLTYVVGDYVSVYGIPQLMMSVVRSADINKTPDVRTRAILPEWACQLSVVFTKPLIKETAVANLLAAAGMTQGIGDWRVQKGSGNYGQFELAGTDNADWQRIVATGGREAQDAAIANPETYDSETDELLAWFESETKRRGLKIAA